MSDGRLVFLSGVGMQPAAIRETYPGAKFISRARIEAEPDEVSSFFANALPETDGKVTVWGLAVETSASFEGPERQGRSDADEELDLILTELPLLAGDPEAVLSAALYWELTPSYTTIVRDAVGVAAPEAEGGWESAPLEAEPPASTP